MYPDLAKRYRTRNIGRSWVRLPQSGQHLKHSRFSLNLRVSCFHRGQLFVPHSESKLGFLLGDLAHTDLARIQKIVGMKLGKHIHDYANGIDPSPVLAEPEEAKGYSISTTLEEDVKKADQAYPVLLALADSVTARIRSDGAKAYCVAVTIRDNSFKTRSHQRSLMNPTDISKEVYEIAKELFDELWDGVTPLRLLGIALTNITREETVQFSLFQDEGREKSRKIDKTRDALNAKFGFDTIVRGSSIQSKIDVGKKYQAQMDQKKKGNHE